MTVGVREVIVVGGTAGTGKTTTGEKLAEKVHAAYIEGDKLHPPENIKKMAANIPLDDEDRWGWLEAVARFAAASACGKDGNESGIAVVSCSALKKVYRDSLRTHIATYSKEESQEVVVRFLFLYADEKILTDRLLHRPNHYMKPAMLQSQFATLELPSGSELLSSGGDVLLVDSEKFTSDEIANMASGRLVASL